MKVVIVGGVAGGATAAARIRRLDERAEIVMFERSGYVSYANCGLPYYIGGTIQGEESLTLRTPAGFWERFRIDARVKSEVTKIDREAHKVFVRELETGKTYEEAYDKLILAPGAKPFRPNIPGADSGRIHVLRTVEDTLRIRQIVVDEKPRRALVVGGGFIGLEMAENLADLGIEVSIAVRSRQLMPVLDADMAHLLHTTFRNNGVKLLFGKNSESFEESNGFITTKFDDGTSISTDMIIMAVGVSPDSSLAKDAGLDLGAKGSIAVDVNMKTSDPDIYAVGDAVQITHLVSGKPAVIALAGPANKEARVAADNICGIGSSYLGSAGSSVMKAFDMTVAVTGLNEKAALAQDIDYERIVLRPASHATYYPGARNMTMKLLFERGTERILGAQIIGYEGVDKRIDVIATAMQAGLTASGLAKLDLAYAPPYSSAKDPVNMAGFMAENIEVGLISQFHWEDVPALQQNPKVFLLDTRTPKEYERGHIEGFTNIPLDELRERLDEIPSDKTAYVICQSGLRSYLACRILSQNGIDCRNFSGGYAFYKAVVLDEQMAEKTLSCGMEL